MPSMIAIVHSIYSKSVHAPDAHAGLMDNESERYCTILHTRELHRVYIPYNLCVITALGQSLDLVCCILHRFG